MRQNKLQGEKVHMKPQNQDAPCPSITSGVQTPQIFDGHTSVIYFGGLQRPIIWRTYVREIFWGSTAPRYLTEPHPSNILGVYSPQIFDGTTSVKYFWGCRPPKYLTDVHPSNILGVYNPQIFDGHTSVKHLGGLRPPNI